MPRASSNPHPSLLPASTPASAHAAVSCRKLSRVYGSNETSVHALRDVSASFAAGEFTAIMGPSGSGKSTLMHLLAGLDTPTTGEVTIAGQQIVGMNDRELTKLRRDRLGFIFQSFNLVPTLTARENIGLPLRLAGNRVDEREVERLAAQLGIADRLTHLPHELSGGQQQRVAVARALISQPAVVFADEPTGALDLRTGRELLQHMQQAARERGQTIIMVTHDPAAAAFADRTLILVDGKIAHELRDADYEQIAAVMAEVGA